MYYLTERKNPHHAFLCMLGLSPLHHMHKTGAGRLGRNLHGTTPGRTAPDSAVRFTLPTPGPKRSAPREHPALQADAAPARLGQNLGFGSAPHYPAWVIQTIDRKLLTTLPVRGAPLWLPVNSR